MEKINVAEWTVMIYMNAEPPGFDKSLQESIEEFNYSGSNKDVNIMILVDRNNPVDTDAILQTYPFPSVYRVLKDQPITIHTKPLHVIENETMGDPTVLEEFLTYCKNEYPAKKYMLSFWDHGTGTGVEADTQEMERTLETLVETIKNTLPAEHTESLDELKNQILKRQKPKRIISTLFNVKPPDTKNNKMKLTEGLEKAENFLYVAEIDLAIKNAFKDEPKFLMDIVAFDACWLQMFENAYTLKDRAKYMVASENLISVDGMGYRNFFFYLSKYPESNAQETASLLINSSFLKVGEEDKFTMSALNCEKAEMIAERIGNLSGIMTKNLSTLFISIRNARFLCLSYFDEEDPSEYDLKVIDLVYFLKKLITNLEPLADAPDTEPDEKKLYQQIIVLCQEIATLCALEFIEYKQIGSGMSEEKENDKRWGAHGFSIFFPEYVFEWEVYKVSEGFYFPVDGVPALPFAANNWKQFLEDYFAMMSNA